MNRISLVLAALAVAVVPALAQEEPKDFSKQIFFLEKTVATPTVNIDVTEAPELKPWMEEAQKLAAQWFPRIAEILATDDYAPPKTVNLVFKKGIDAPAYAAGNTITIKVEWIQQHPEDFGMVVHEMTHVIQQYKRTPRDTGWLVEGIADYVRWWRYEPETPRPKIDPKKNSYRDSYRITAAFLAWAVGKYDRQLVRKLDKGLRSGTYNVDIWEKSTGKKLDDLWAEFVAPK